MSDAKAIQDNPTAGVSYALGAAIMLASMNMMAKILSAWFSPVEITFYRNVIALLLLVGGMAVFGRIALVNTGRPIAQFVRAVIGTIGMILAVQAFALLPLATATILIFTAPLFVVLLSYPVLKEPVGLPRICAVLAGFVGVALMVGLNTDLSMVGLITGLAAGLANAFVQLSLRWLGTTEDATTTTFYFLFYGLIGTGLAMPFIASPMPSEAHMLIPAIGVIGLISLLFKTQSYRLAPVSVISPVTYTILIWASLYDFLIWGRIVDVPTIIGGLIIITSNIYIVYRERQLKKKITVEV